MTVLASILPIDWQQQLGWVLVHSVWQIALIAAFYAMASVALRRTSANVRYVLGCAALLAMVAAPVATFFYSTPAISVALEQETSAGATAILPDGGSRGIEGVSLEVGAFELDIAPQGDYAAEPSAITVIPALEVVAPLATYFWPALFEALLPWLSIGWLIGVAVLALRPLLGLYTVHQLRTRGLTPLSEELQRLAGRLMMQLRISQAVQFAESAFIQVPSVVGYLRPMVLLPASAVTGLGIDQLELLLAHELAHVRRHDYLINLLQTIVETLLFYHPAMWWLSMQLRNERECCCDDVVVALCGNRPAYIRTLWAMENQRDAAVPMLAMSGGALAERIRRLAFGQPAAFQYGAGWLGSFIVLGLVALLLSLGQSFGEETPVEVASEVEQQEAVKDAVEEQDQTPTSLVGRIVYNGTPPDPQPLNIPLTTRFWDGEKWVDTSEMPERRRYRELGLKDESLVIGNDGGIANVVVWARSKDIPPPLFSGPLPPTAITITNGSLPLPTTPLFSRQLPSSTIRAKDGRFDPHVLAFWKAAPLKWVNELPEATNFNWRGARNTKANRMMPAGKQIDIEVKRGEAAPTELVSNLDYWMRAFILPLDHPYFAVTRRDGRFEINQLPLGQWEFAIWHERTGWLKTDRFPTGKFTWQIKPGENAVGDLLVEPNTLTESNRPTKAAAESVAQSENIDPETLIPQLPTYAACPIKKAFQAQIIKALEEVKERGEGHVIVGRVLVDGEDDPSLVYAQMEILSGGYFATPVGNLVDPVGFRMHGYAPYDLEFKDHEGKLIDVGVIQMRRLPDAELTPLIGRVTMEGDGDLSTVSLGLTVTDAPINSPSGGTEPRSRWPDALEIPLDSAGRFYYPKLSPIRYNAFVGAPGYVRQHHRIDVEPDKVAEMKTIVLEKPRRISLEYVVAKNSPFDLDNVRLTVIQGGGRWQFTPHPYRWDLEFDQRNGRLYFDWSYGPIFLADLGPGELSDFVNVEGGIATKHPREFAVADGNVYLIRRPNWEQGYGEDLALFKVRVEGGNAPAEGNVPTEVDKSVPSPTPATPEDSLRAEAGLSPDENSAGNVIATVLGRKIFRRELEPPPQWHLTREEHIRKHDITSGLESLEQFHRRRLFELTAKPLINEYKKQHQLQPTEEEIKEFMEHDAQIRLQQKKEYEEKLKRLRADEAKLVSSQPPLDQQAEHLRQLEAVRKEIASIERTLSINSSRPSDREFKRFSATWRLDHWKLHSTLYKQYGGRVVWQQVGNEAIDALRDFFREEEAKGRLVIHDDKLRRMFWEPFTQEKLSFVVSDPERVFSKPWPVDESPDDQ